MKNVENWRPSKYVFKNGFLIASRDPSQVGVASRLIADITARHYEEYLGKYAKGRLIDLGCGKVPLYAAYKDYVTENICADWENTLHASEFLDFTCDLTQTIPVGDAEFDTIVISDVLEHIPNPELIWSEMARILREGGKILLNVPFYYWLHEGPHDFYRYTVFALERFARQAGLSVVLIKPIGGVPEILADILAKNSVRLPKGLWIAALIQVLAAFFVRTKAGRRISQSTGKAFPLGYFMVVEKPADVRG